MSEYYFQGKPIICLDLPALRNAESKTIESIIIHNDAYKLSLDASQNPNIKRNLKEMHLFACQTIQANINQDENLLAAIRKQIAVKYNVSEFI